MDDPAVEALYKSPWSSEFGMSKVQLSKIKNKFSAFIKAVQGGAHFEITVRGVPVAQLTPISKTSSKVGFYLRVTKHMNSPLTPAFDTRAALLKRRKWIWHPVPHPLWVWTDIPRRTWDSGYNAIAGAMSVKCWHQTIGDLDHWKNVSISIVFMALPVIGKTLVIQSNDFDLQELSLFLEAAAEWFIGKLCKVMHFG